MENASKALLIAGGLLLAMLVVSLLVILQSNMNKMASAENDKKATQQLTAFNSTYEAYNKKYLKGNDVITVVNKAIENNLNLDDTHPWFIDVVVIPTQNFVSTTKRVRADGTIITPEAPISGPVQMQANATYSLKGTGPNNMNAGLIKFFDQPVTNKIVENSDQTTTYTYSALTNFQKAIFTCSKVDYTNGRVSKITFTQTKT
ncbi:MAG: hypothetical protein FWC53_04355 [Firmicutes bacterium]|nr:hypothetical protein [Bacillota bacterium]